MDHVIRPEEPAISNFNGAKVYSGVEWKKRTSTQINPAFRALVAQTEAPFPGSTNDTRFQMDLQKAVNNKCRKIAHS